MDDRKPAWLRWGGVALGLLLALLVGLWLRDILVSDKPAKKPTIQKITLVRPPPPPPPPKPPEKPPEPEVKQEVKVPEPEQPQPKEAEAPPPGPDLAVDAEGTGSGDGFGLVGKKGGSDLIGGGGGGKGNPWAWYDAIVNEAINAAFQSALSREQALKDKNYRVVVKVWIDPTGAVTRAQVVDSTGDARVDDLLKEVLRNMRALRDNPPQDMPQPIKIRVTSRA